MRLQAQFAQRAVAAGGMPNMGPYGMPPPGAPMYYGQPPPGVMGPPQPQPGFGMPMMPPGGPGRGPMGPGGPGMQYVMPMPQRQGMPGQRGRGGRGGQGGGRGQGRQNMHFPVQNQPPAPTGRTTREEERRALLDFRASTLDPSDLRYHLSHCSNSRRPCGVG